MAFGPDMLSRHERTSVEPLPQSVMLKNGLAPADLVWPRHPAGPDSIAVLSNEATSHDFRGDEMGVLARRIEQQILLLGLERENFAAYMGLLLEAPEKQAPLANTALLAPNGELQSLNNDLAALDNRLLSSLDHQWLTSDDLQNMLFRSNIATLFLDLDLNIRVYNPALKSHFSIIAGDIGRPLSDLRLMATDPELIPDARQVAADMVPVEREVPGSCAEWFLRRIVPHRGHDNYPKGVVITFTDVTGYILIAKALEAARLEVERAELAKSRFLAAASHDLNQPMQTLTLLKHLLMEAVIGEEPRKLLVRLEQTLGVMSGMLSVLFETDQVEPGTIEPGIAIFSINDGPAPVRTAKPGTLPTTIVTSDIPPYAQAAAPSNIANGPVTYVVDDNAEIRSTLRYLLEDNALAVADFASAEAFLEAYQPGGEGCLLLDAHLPGGSGLQLLATLRGRGDHLPTILISGSHDIGLAVNAMRSGACDFLEKPFRGSDLLASIARAIDSSHDLRLINAAGEDAATHVAILTTRQREIMDLVLDGHRSKNIAANLGISQRTVENHRAAIMRKMRVKSLPELARKAQAAAVLPFRGIARKPELALAADGRLHA